MIYISEIGLIVNAILLAYMLFISVFRFDDFTNWAMVAIFIGVLNLIIYSIAYLKIW